MLLRLKTWLGHMVLKLWSKWMIHSCVLFWILAATANFNTLLQLLLNDSKTEVLHLTSRFRRNPTPISTIKVGDSEVDIASEVHKLRVLFDQHYDSHFASEQSMSRIVSGCLQNWPYSEIHRPPSGRTFSACICDIQAWC